MDNLWIENLYKYGFLLTNDEDASLDCIGVNSEDWVCKTEKKWKLFVHSFQTFCSVSKEETTAFLFGHAYNPFTMEAEEKTILSNLLNLLTHGEEFYDYLDQITGSFCLVIDDGCKVSVFVDCAGMYGANYSLWRGNIYISSHFQMVADLLSFEEDPYISRMKKSKTWPLFGYYLPGDLTSYCQIKRVLPNTKVVLGNDCVSIDRFYPRKSYAVVSDDEYENVVRSAGDILHNSMRLIAQKWEKPAISQTGGMDSKTTLACSNGVREKFHYYSYISLPREATDAYAAKEICERLGVPHEIIEVDIGKYGQLHDRAKEIIKRNYGYLGDPNDNDVDKRIELLKKFSYNIEVKSWVSEIARASRYGKYRKKKFAPKPTPRMLTSMYKIFTTNRREAKETDIYFDDYLKKTQLLDCIEKYHYPWTEFFVWEIVFGGWGGLALTAEHMVSNNITVPFNNRVLLDIMLKAPLEKRRTDTLHRDIIDYMDDRVNQIGISVVNGNETKFRAVCERLYYDIHSRLPF